MKLSISLACVALVAGSFVVGCSSSTPGGGNGNGGTQTTGVTAPEGFQLKCTTELKITHFDYEVSGNTLTVSVGGQSLSLVRAAQGAGNAVNGTWKLPAQPVDGDPAFVAQHKLTIEGTLTIEDGRVGSTAVCGSKYVNITAHTSSPAKITDAGIDILEAHHEYREWTQAGGEKVDSLSFDPYGKAHAPVIAALGMSFPPAE